MNAEYYRNYYREHRERYLALHRAHYQKTKANNRARNLQQKYGISIEQYDEMFVRQNGQCAICARHQSQFKKILAVDHDHKTGQVRGLLCSKCNTDLAVIEDKSFCVKASLYLGTK